ncbi:hypothetical protein GJ744_006174 [Endocarpon pusillum]|uniref:Uncharacterized protein n=1 Tax=Endocarpon pusillum TaxID=364733 RepID=A0A8H7DZA4_9EURO|nr:hypothetical protein GJ744_006174 [Endocarpon pusillum]
MYVGSRLALPLQDLDAKPHHFRHTCDELRSAGTRRDSLDCELSTSGLKLHSLAGCIWKVHRCFMRPPESSRMTYILDFFNQDSTPLRRLSRKRTRVRASAKNEHNPSKGQVEGSHFPRTAHPISIKPARIMNKQSNSPDSS